LQHNHLLLLLTSVHFALEAELLGFPAISVLFGLRRVTEQQLFQLYQETLIKYLPLAYRQNMGFAKDC
jgi:hypothetical protein